MKVLKFVFPVFILLVALGCAAPSQSATPAQVGSPDVVEETSPASEANQASTASSTEQSALLNECPTDVFLDANAAPQNAAYPEPELSITCTDTEILIQTNNIPNFEFVPTTPNALQAQDFTFHIPLTPVMAAETTAVPLGGPSAIAVNGLVIFGPTEAPNDGYRDPYLDEILDYCNGHTAPGGVYHFHARPDCISDDLEGQVGLVIAYAFDGYPILAPYICGDEACSYVKEVQSSWRLANPDLDNAWEKHEYVEGRSELDECNGMTLPDGSYAYFATDTFPYFMGCYRGVVDESNFFGQGPGGPGADSGGQPQPELDLALAAPQPIIARDEHLA